MSARTRLTLLVALKDRQHAKLRRSSRRRPPPPFARGSGIAASDVFPVLSPRQQRPPSRKLSSCSAFSDVDGTTLSEPRERHAMMRMHRLVPYDVVCLCITFVLHSTSTSTPYLCLCGRRLTSDISKNQADHLSITPLSHPYRRKGFEVAN